MKVTRTLKNKNLLALTLGMCSCTVAQTVSAAESSSVEEIIVTARRTQESIQSVPVSMAAYSAEALREASVVTPSDLQFQTPGVFLQGSAAPQNAAYSIRGQGLSIAGFGLPGVITYFSEVPLPAYGSSNPQYDMASIQVLKGPQGTLFGRNTTGGAVLLTPAAPTYEFEGYVQATGGNFSHREGEAMLNIPIVADKVALRIAGHTLRRDGYTKNLGVGGDLDDQHTDDVRVSLLLQPADWLKNTTTFDYSKTDSVGGSQILYATNEPTLTNTDAAFGAGGFLVAAFNAAVAQQRALGPFTTSTNIAPIVRFTNKGLTNRTDFDVGGDWGLQVTNLFGYRSLDNLTFNNIDGLGATFPLFGGFLLDGRRFIDNEQYTDELQLRGEKGDVRWLVGAFYLDNRPSGPTGSQNTIFGNAVPGSYRFYEEKSIAGYANIAYKLNGLVEGLTFNAGFRYTKDKAELCDGTDPAVTAPPFNVDEDDCRSGALPIFSTNEAEFNGTTWTIGLDWQINDELFTYITSRRGYRGGGINSPVLNPSPANLLRGFQKYQPDEVTDVELGLRSDWLIGNMQTRFNVSVFRSKTTDAQRAITGFQTIPTGPTTCISLDGDCNAANDPFDTGLLVNYGDTTIDGAEVELTIRPVDSLALNVGGAIQDPQTDSINPAIRSLAPILPTLGFDPNEVPFDATPEKTLTAGIRWELPLPSSIGGVVFNADYFWVEDTQLVAVKIPSYNITNLRLDWNGIAGMPLDIGVFARNAFDKEYVLTTANPTAISPYFTVAYGAPRMYGAQLRYSF